MTLFPFHNPPEPGRMMPDEPMTTPKTPGQWQWGDPMPPPRGRASTSAALPERTIDNVPSCGQENDYRRSAGYCWDSYMTNPDAKAAELLPCPCCASASELGMLNNSIFEGHFVTCMNGKCECRSGIFPTKPMAVRTWNTRTPATPPSQPALKAKEPFILLTCFDRKQCRHPADCQCDRDPTQPALKAVNGLCRHDILQDCPACAEETIESLRAQLASARKALETIARTTFSGNEIGEEYHRGNHDAHTVCAKIARAALTP